MRAVVLGLCLLGLSAAQTGRADDKDTKADRKPTIVQLMEGKTKATVKTGEVVYCGVKKEIAEELAVKVNGKTIKKPKTDRSGPSGAGLYNFVFEAKKKGKYKIEVTPIYEGKKRKPVIFEVVVE
jgi:hypothetical protein